MGSGSKVELEIVVEPPPITDNETPNVNRPPVIALPQTNNQASAVRRFVANRLMDSLRRLWNAYLTLWEEGAVMPGYAFNFVIRSLIGFTAIKSQGNTSFPFKSHPQTITVAITSVIVFGLASAAEYITSGPNSVYASIARLGRMLCLYVLVGSLASLFYL